MDDTAAESAADLAQAPPALEPEPIEPLPASAAEQPAHSDARERAADMDTAAAAKPASGTAEEPRDVADNLQPVGADFAAFAADNAKPAMMLTPYYRGGDLSSEHLGQDQVCLPISGDADDDSFCIVRGLTRGRLRDSAFAIWHIDLPEHTTSDALAADVLSPAADHIQRGDVIFITTKDGTLLRAMSVRGGKVCLAPVI